MTSSLVGSEMCIRDRARVCGYCLCPPSVITLTAVTVAGDDEDDGVAVSYTHLTLPTICSV
eukprot:1839145-Prorocentrum_lima.AAC.1